MLSLGVTHLFQIHFIVFKARNTVETGISEGMKYNSHALQGVAWYWGIWQPVL